MSREERKLELLGRIAKQTCMGMKGSAIAKLLNISEEDLSKLRSMEEYKTIYAAEEIKPAYEKLNHDWDTIEQLTVGALVTKLQFESKGMKVSELLGVANIANKAQRRGMAAENIAQSHGNTVVINLNMNSINRHSKTTVNGNYENRPSINSVQKWGESLNDMDTIHSNNSRDSMDDRNTIDLRELDFAGMRN